MSRERDKQIDLPVDGLHDVRVGFGCRKEMLYQSNIARGDGQMKRIASGIILPIHISTM